MADFFYTLELTATSIIDWFVQQDRPVSEAPGGDIEIGAWTTEAYIIQGTLVLASELRTFNRADELAEYYSLDAEYFELADVAGEKVAYCRTDAHGSFWVIPDRPFIRKHTGENKAVVVAYCSLIGSTTDYQAGYLMEDLDELTNDWSI